MPKREDNIKLHTETATWAQRRGLGREVRSLEGRKKGGAVAVLREMREPKPEKAKKAKKEKNTEE